MPTWGQPIEKESLEELYYKRGLSVQEIAELLGASHHKVVYWMDQHGLQRRDASEASYRRHNPGGEKFRIDSSQRELFIAGVALYLGEGAKTRSWDLSLANSDPRILKLWVRFLEIICSVPPENLKARISCYDDLDYQELLAFWSETLGIPVENFERPTVKRSRVENGNREVRQSLFGTVHVKFYDAKLKSLMTSWMNDLLEGRL